MNTHKNARLTYLRRLEMVQDITERGVSASDAAAAHGVSAVTARKWLARHLVDGASGLLDKSSRPEKSPRSIAPHVALAIVELRRKLYTKLPLGVLVQLNRLGNPHRSNLLGDWSMPEQLRSDTLRALH